VFGCGFGSSAYEMRDVLEMEMRLLHTLDYNLIIYHPLPPLTVYAPLYTASLTYHPYRPLTVYGPLSHCLPNLPPLTAPHCVRASLTLPP